MCKTQKDKEPTQNLSDVEIVAGFVFNTKNGHRIHTIWQRKVVTCPTLILEPSDVLCFDLKFGG